MELVEKATYALTGLTGRATTAKRCPACGSGAAEVISRKLFHSFSVCSNCGLRFRYPVETAGQMAKYYQKDYTQSGLTTDLPDDSELERLLNTGFAGSIKDFSSAIALFRHLGFGPGARVLDYGANWGYATWQFRKAGFSAQGFEVSVPRARFGRKLGLDIATRLDDLDGPFDLCFSSHVLEHVPNPMASIEDQLSLVRPGGIVIGVTPNGSEARFRADRRAYDLHWGKVHPVLLTDSFIAHVAAERPYHVTSGRRLEEAPDWDRRSQVKGQMTAPHLQFAIVG